MKLEILKPAKSLNKAYLKQDLKRNQIELFKSNLTTLFSRANEADKKKESEEHFKNLVADFLKDTFYKPQNEVNTSGRTDLVIHNGKSSSDTVGVIIEAKRPTNATEMITKEKPNLKALHELLHYYMQERYIKDNKEIKHLIATNIYEWFVFDGAEFEKFFFENPKLKKQYKEWNDGLFGLNKTDWFYQEVAKPFIDKELENLTCTYFNLKEVEKIILKKEAKEDKRLIDLYKILSAEHLLKKPFANDSNTLNKDFYSELLHLIGLEETKDGSRKIIQRKAEAERNEGSLLENTIREFDARNRLMALGVMHTNERKTQEEEIFSAALELCITWLNRILFLKLLEGQLIKYHKGYKNFAFLNINRIKDFDEVNELFFEVLALKISERPAHVKQKFGDIPYLNSSLFDPTDFEQKYFFITALKSRLEISVLTSTVLKDGSGKKISGKKNTLQYLFEFLDAYDFASDSSAEIQEQNKTIINASVLGLIFEKINGYKDGSFFTPGFITMYMCRETIRKAVIQKFNTQHKWSCSNFNELYNKLEKVSIEEANETINDLKICDPAVGSGHFLVSALNEIIGIKHDLGILVDSEGKRLKGYSIVIENDELIITHEDEIFEYNYKDKESQRIQETLFHEKQNLIENCLFGVDLNPKSVMICRLRLWIELLKNSYYTKASDYKELETLPNIDINIKCGNSLISRFALNDDLSTALKSIKYSINDYRNFVNDYKNASDKELKRGLEKIIADIKSNFRTQINRNNPTKKRLDKLIGELYQRFTGNMLFEPNADYGNNKDKNDSKEKLETEITKLSKELEDQKNSLLYKNAFEWRFEFPEVLDDEGNYIGFNVVIGNPPYIPLESFSEIERKFFREKYLQLERKYETSVSFILGGLSLLNNNGLLSYIAPVTWQTGENYTKFRQHILSNNGIWKLINLPFNIFEDAYVDTALYFLSKNTTDEYSIYAFDKKAKTNNLFDVEFSTFKISDLKKPDFKLIIDKSVQQFSRFDNDNFIELGLITKSTQGLSGSNFPEGVAQEEENTFSFLSKGNVYNYLLVKEQTYLTDLTARKNLIGFYQDVPKILIRRIINRQDRLSVTFCMEKLVFKKDINPFIPTDENFDAKYLTGVLASKFISYLYINSSSIATKDDFRQTTLTELRNLPIPKASDKEQKKIIKLVDGILEKKRKSAEADSTDLEKEIDQLVYELYNITEEEQKIIEEA